MVRIGYALSSEEHAVGNLVDNARQAEESGFTFALISDHYHPWVSEQGESPFVWAVLGAIAQVTQHLQIGTGVTCPIMRTHPAIIAQAASTVSAMMPGRFFLGLGTGEYLNEHIFGDPWPTADVRQEMLTEAIFIMRELWKGAEFSFDGKYFSVVDAQIFTRSDTPPPVYLAASGEESAQLAGEVGDGLITTSLDSDLVEAFRSSGAKGKKSKIKPAIAQFKVCWAPVKGEARRTVQRWWPSSEVPGRLKVDLPTPSHFRDVIDMMEEPKVSKEIVLGPNVDEYLVGFKNFVDAGFDHVYFHQIGPDQVGFLRFFREKLLPELARENFIEC